jgi:hypothetical protein
VAEAVRLVVRLPQPLPAISWPQSTYLLFQPQWLPLSFIELDATELHALEKTFGTEAIRYFEAIDLELCRGIDACLTEAETLIHPRPNGFEGRGGQNGGWEHDGYPVMTGAGQIAGDPGLDIETPACRFVALNLSKQDEPGEFDPGAPLSVATQVASKQLLVVIASGNEGERDEVDDTRSPWARAPWVLAVGASEDEEGTRLAPYSGRSADGSEPQLVAWGASALDKSKLGTSFAAPRVIRETLVLATWLESLRYAVALARQQSPPGIPLVGEAMIDVGEPGWPSKQLPLPAYPFVGVNQHALVEALVALGPDADGLDLAPTPGRLRNVLARSGRPLAKAGQRFVSPATTREYLAAFNGLDLAQVGLGREVEPAAGLDVPLAEPGDLPRAIEIWDQGSLHLYYEQETGVTTWN